MPRKTHSLFGPQTEAETIQYADNTIRQLDGLLVALESNDKDRAVFLIGNLADLWSPWASTPQYKALKKRTERMLYGES